MKNILMYNKETYYVDVMMSPPLPPSSLDIDIDAKECLAKGLVGFLGAVPATVAAHPCDAIKIRMQISGQHLSLVLKSIPTTNYVSNSSSAAACGRNVASVISNLYSGLGAGIQQKMFTRGPMFFFSNLSTQICEKKMNLDRTLATFVGSTFSGYCTGFIAAPREWMKVLSNNPTQTVGTANYSASTSTISAPIQNNQHLRSSLIMAAYRSNNLPSLFKRMHGAGCRNAIFDSIFFGTQHIALERFKDVVSPAWAYACAATVALTIDYAVDVTVKRSMSVPPKEAAYINGGVLKSTFNLLRSKGLVVAYRGLSVKSVEFLISYFITGACSVAIFQFASNLLKD